MAQLLPGAVLGARFVIQGVLGSGGMATVYLARDQLRGEAVALKVMHDHLAQTPSMRERLRRELLATSRLRHPNILVVHEIHELDGHLALSLPFHQGSNLQERIATDGPLSAEALEQLARELAGALAEAHRQGIIHRDVTPSNVMLADKAAPDGTLGANNVLTDFGLARLEELRTATATATMGTAGYAAPEIYQQVRAEPRSDLYSLGAVLYFAATGKGPFEASNPMAVLKRQMEEDYKPLASVRPDLPAHLVEVISSLLHRDPASRPQGARAVLEDLEAGEAPEPLPPTVDSTPLQPSFQAAPPSLQGDQLLQSPGGTASGQNLPALQGQPASLTTTGSGPARAGTWTVVLEPRRTNHGPHRHWRHRRGLYRNRQDVINAWKDSLEQWEGTTLGKKFQKQFQRDLRSVEKYISPEGPEEKLIKLVGAELGLPEGGLQFNETLFERRFRVLAGIDSATASRLASGARRLSYDATVLDASKPEDAVLPSFSRRHLRLFIFLATILSVMAVMGIASIRDLHVFAIIVIPILAQGGRALWKHFQDGPIQLDSVPLAFSPERNGYELAAAHPPALLEASTGTGSQTPAAHNLRAQLAAPSSEQAGSSGASGRALGNAAPEKVAAPTPPVDANSPLGRINALRVRTAASLKTLENSLSRVSQALPEHIFKDIYATFLSLSQRAESLGAQAVRIQQDLDALDDEGSAAAVARIENRLERLKTLSAANGTLTPELERLELERSLDSHRQIVLEAEQLEGQLTLAMARLLEIGAAATRTRRDLERQQVPAQSAHRLLEQLQREVGAAAQALNEVERSLKGAEGNRPSRPVSQTITSGELLKNPNISPATLPPQASLETVGADGNEQERKLKAEQERQRLAALARNSARQ